MSKQVCTERCFKMLTVLLTYSYSPHLYSLNFDFVWPFRTRASCFHSNVNVCVVREQTSCGRSLDSLLKESILIWYQSCRLPSLPPSLCRLSGNSLTVLTGNRTCNHHTQPGVHCDFDSCAFKLFLVLSISGGSSDFNEKKNLLMISFSHLCSRSLSCSAINVIFFLLMISNHSFCAFPVGASAVLQQQDNLWPGGGEV